jgi:tyrosyl-tRNA synthetase
MNGIITDKDKIEDLLTRGVEEVFIREDLKAKLLSGKQLRIKLGVDPTSPFIHLGRAIPLRKLKAFQDLGHHIVLIIGDYTAKIGDPSDKLEKRPMLTDEAIQHNLEKYLDQISLILDITKVEVQYNSTWLKSMNFFEVGKLLESFTVQQMSKRRNFKERLDAGSDIYISEFLYPALQGYDSVMVKSDVEIGGFDQLFNLKAGRTVQKKYGQEEQDIITLSMLEGTDGRKMSSSWGNIISVVDTPEEMFGKIMSLNDDLIIKYFLLATEMSQAEISEIAKCLTEGENPMNVKKKLGKEVVTLYHSKSKAEKAQESWENTFQKKEIPTDVEVIQVKEGTLLVDAFLEKGIVSSKSDFRRLVDEHAVTNLDTDEKVATHTASAENGVYKIGKKRFAKIELI